MATPATTSIASMEEKEQHHRSTALATIITNTTEHVLSQEPPISRRVTFDTKTIGVYHIDCIKDMSPEVIDATWYSQDELTRIEDVNKLTVKLMKIRRENPEQFGYCYRGLEYRLPHPQEGIEGLSSNAAGGSSYRHGRNTIMMTAITAVLAEQQRRRRQLQQQEQQQSEMTSGNRTKGDYPEEMTKLLASVYEGFSKSCREKAIQLAMTDEQLARIIHQEPSISCPIDPPFSMYKGGRRGSICSSTIMSDSDDLSCTIVDVQNSGEDMSDLSDNEELGDSPRRRRSPRRLMKQIKGYWMVRNEKKPK